MIQCVENLRAERHPHPLRHLESLRNPHVQVPKRRPLKDVPPHSELPRSGIGKHARAGKEYRTRHARFTLQLRLRQRRHARRQRRLQRTMSLRGPSAPAPPLLSGIRSLESWLRAGSTSFSGIDIASAVCLWPAADSFHADLILLRRLGTEHCRSREIPRAANWRISAHDLFQKLADVVLGVVLLEQHVATLKLLPCHAVRPPLHLLVRRACNDER